MKRYLLIFLALAAVCCSKGGDSLPDEPSARPIGRIAVLTKAASGATAQSPGVLPENLSTFRVMVYAQNNYRYFTSGTYRYVDDGDDSNVDYLIASRLTSAGEFLCEDPYSGLNTVTGEFPYDIAIVSPGLVNDGGFIPFCPNAGELEGRLLVGGISNRMLGEYPIITLDSLMYDRRSRLEFRFFRGPNVSELRMNSISVRGAGTCTSDGVAFYNPASRQVRAEGLYVCSDFTAGRTGEGDEYVGTAPVYVSSGIYAPKDQAAAILRTYVFENLIDSDFLTATLNFDQGARLGIEQDLILNNFIPELSPLHEYIFNITIKSNYIEVYLEIHDGTATPDNGWELAPGSGIGSIDNPDGIFLGRWPLGGENGDSWEDPALDPQIIG